MKIYLPEKVKFIIDEIYSNGYEAFIVGGCVRDSILGIEPNDYDITTNAKPEIIKKIFNDYKIIDNGIKHGTVGVIIDKEVYEITTYRIEGEYEKNRRPKSVEFTSDIILDLKRRDFTINSMAYNDKVGLLDKFNGIADIKGKIVKTVGNPDDRFSEDGLRIVRAIRFSSKLGFEIENKTLKSIYKNADIIENISKERITDEFTKTILSENPQNIILLYRTEILKKIGIHNYINEDIAELEKNLSILRECDFNIEDRLAMLEYILGFNEINNIDCKKIGKLEYYIKNIKSKNIINTLMYLKKVSIKSNTMIECMILDGKEYDNSIKIKHILKKIDKEILKKSLNLKKMYNKYSLRGKINSSETNEKNKIIDNCINDIIRIENLGECYSIKNIDISGNDLVKLGYRGKDIGERLELLLNEVIKNPELNKKNKLIKLLEN
ncbi:MAG: polynucleotide adenylyltransferase [Romboutsia sp.]